MATCIFTHNSESTKILKKNTHKKVQKSFKNFKRSRHNIVGTRKISQKQYSLLAILDSQGIVVQCTAVIFSRIYGGLISSLSYVDYVCALITDLCLTISILFSFMKIFMAIISGVTQMAGTGEQVEDIGDARSALSSLFGITESVRILINLTA